MLSTMTSRCARGFIVGLLAMIGTACGSSESAAPPAIGGACTGDSYCAGDMWLCRPDLVLDRCAETQTETVIAVDGSRTEHTLPKAENPAVDCFYVYPTVALDGPAGNVSDFSNLTDILRPLQAQALPLTEHCRVYAPLYHQMTGESYVSPDYERFFETAYADVARAFEVFLRHYNQGRDFLIVGHSQGSHVLTELLRRRIEPDVAVRSSMVVAMPIGPTGRIVVPIDGATGGTFRELKLCTERAERGCIVAYDTLGAVPAGSSATPARGATMDLACTNPAALGTSSIVPLAGSSFYASVLADTPYADVATTFATFPFLYSAACARGATGAIGLQISLTKQPGDQRSIPFDVETTLQLHAMDFGFTRKDLLELLRAKIEAK